MSRPVLTVRIALVNAPFTAIASLTWVDISAYVWLENNPGGQQISINRGRQFELDSMQAGTCTLILDNRDRRFDPDNTASPYYPNVIPTKRINVRATWASVTYDVFTGYVESWVPIDATASGISVNVVRLTAVDLFKALNYTTLILTELGDNNPVNVINDVLNIIGWPEADRSFGSNSPTQIPAQTWPKQAARPLVQTIETADGGTFFMETDGRAFYRDRYWTARNRAIQAVFGDAAIAPTVSLSSAINASVTTIPVTSVIGYSAAGTVLIDNERIAYTSTSAGQLLGCTRGAYGSTAASHSSLSGVVPAELPYQDVQFSFDDTRLINHADVTRVGGTLQSADDTSSQAIYGVRAAQITNLQITTDAEALARAQYMVILYAQPFLRVQTLLLNGDLGMAYPSLWPQILGRTFSEAIVVIRRPPGGGAPIVKQERIQAITHSIGANVWTCAWQLSPTGNDQFFILDSATSGVLDTNRLAY